MEAFWELTPKELHLAFEAALWLKRKEQRRDAWLAWHVAALGRAKRLPALRKMLTQQEPARALKGDEMARRQAEHNAMVKRMTRK